jgi:hypothetical protein
MCWYLIVAIPRDEKDLSERILPGGLSLVDCANKCVRRTISDTFQCMFLVYGFCSCDLYQDTDEGMRPRRKARARKYRRKGWSEAKIERALQQAQDAYDEKPVGLREDVIRYLDAMVNAGGVVGVLLHFFNGDVDKERFTIKDSIKLGLKKFSDMGELPTDVWIWSRRKCGNADK